MGAMTTVPSDRLSVRPGDEASCEITVRNTGHVVDSFHLEPLGALAAWMRVEPAQLPLMPGTEGTAVVYFEPPRTAADRGASAVGGARAARRGSGRGHGRGGHARDRALREVRGRHAPADVACAGAGPASTRWSSTTWATPPSRCSWPAVTRTGSSTSPWSPQSSRWPGRRGARRRTSPRPRQILARSAEDLPVPGGRRAQRAAARGRRRRPAAGGRAARMAAEAARRRGRARRDPRGALVRRAQAHHPRHCQRDRHEADRQRGGRAQGGRGCGSQLGRRREAGHQRQAQRRVGASRSRRRWPPSTRWATR